MVGESLGNRANPINLVYVQLRKGLTLPRRGGGGETDDLHGGGAVQKVDVQPFS